MKEQEEETQEKTTVKKPKKEQKKKESKEAKEVKPKKEVKRKATSDAAEEPKKKRVRKTGMDATGETKPKPKSNASYTSALNKVKRGTAVVFNTQSNAPCFFANTLKVAADLDEWHDAKAKNESDMLMVVDITTLEITMPLRILSLQPAKYMTNGLFLDHEKLAFCFSQSDLPGSKTQTMKQTGSVPGAVKPDPTENVSSPKKVKKTNVKGAVQEWFFQVQDAKGHNYGMTMATFSELMQRQKIAPIEISEKNEYTMATDDDRMFLVPKEYVDGVWAPNSKVNENLSEVTPAISESFLKALEK